MINNKSQTRLVHLGLVLLVALVAFLHFFTPIHFHPLHAFYQRLYYLPILAAAYRFGWRGGLWYSLLSAITYLPHITWQWDWDGGQVLGQYFEIILFICIGVWVGALFDITRAQSKVLKAQQESLQRSERLSLMGQLAAGLAHEIRNPLNALMGSVDILQRKLNHEPEKEFADIMDREFRRMTHTLDEFLAFARPPLLENLPHRLSDVIEGAIKLGYKTMQKGNVEIKYEHPETETVGEYDAQNIRQIILNLLINAVQHSQNGGTVNISHTQTETESFLLFTDNGSGIADENLEKVFDPFYTTRASGTGLGLSISRQLAESMGGSLKALSHQGGALFELKIPLKNTQYRMEKNISRGKNDK